MRDEILARLEKRIGRRGFLKGSGLAAATIVGAAIAAPLFAQEPPQQQQRQQDDKKDAKGAKDTKKSDDAKTDDSKSGGSSDTETKLDANGNEYRECPQCGGNMYRQGRTWTCENCGYSYVE
jgi:rubredoxin